MRTTDNLAKIVRTVQSGERSSFTTLYYESYKYLHTCVINIIKDENLAEDMLQEAYAEIYRSIAQLNNPYDFLSWAATIANRKCFTYIKKKKDVLVSGIADEEGNETDYFDLISDDEAFIPENIIDNQEKIKIIRDIIDNLTDVQRTCIIGFYYNDQKQEAIAEELDIPVNTVKSHLCRARAKIKEAIGETEQKQGIKLFAIPAFLSLFFAKQTEVFAAESTVPPMGTALNALVSQLAKGTAVNAASVAKTASVVKSASAAVKTKIIVAAAICATVAAVGGGTAVALAEHHNAVEREARIQRELEKREKREAKSKESEQKIVAEAAALEAEPALETEPILEADVIYENTLDPQLVEAYIKKVEEFYDENEDIINEYCNITYGLIYFDDDDIPELVTDLTCSNVGLYAYGDDGLFTVMEGGYGAFGLAGYEYVPKESILAYDDADYAGGAIYSYQLKWNPQTNEFDDLEAPLLYSYYKDQNGDGYIEPSEADDSIVREDVIYYYLGNKEITSEEYDACFDKLFLEVEGINGNMSKDEIIAYLKSLLGEKVWIPLYKEILTSIISGEMVISFNAMACEDYNPDSFQFLIEDITYDGVPELLVGKSNPDSKDDVRWNVFSYGKTNWGIVNLNSMYPRYGTVDGMDFSVLIGEAELKGYDRENGKMYICDSSDFDVSYYTASVKNGWGHVEDTISDRCSEYFEEYLGVEDSGVYTYHNDQSVSAQEFEALLSNWKAEAEEHGFAGTPLIQENIDAIQ